MICFGCNGISDLECIRIHLMVVGSFEDDLYTCMLKDSKFFT